MATVVLLRHGRSTANSSGVLAGRTPGVLLDDRGLEQVAAVGERLAGVQLTEAWSSPLERCRSTAEAAVSRMSNPPQVRLDDRLLECDYGDWQGRAISDLAKEPLWATVQNNPSAAAFPGGESMVAMSQRVVAAVRAHDARIEAEHGSGAVWLLSCHGDPIKAVLADAFGMHLDLFQRVTVDPASVSVVRYTAARPYVVATNTSAGDLGWLSTPSAKAGATPSTDAVVGGGAGREEPVAPHGGPVA